MGPRHAVSGADAVPPGGGGRALSAGPECSGLTVSDSGLHVCWLVPRPCPHHFGVGIAFATLSSVQSPLGLAISSLLRIANPVLLAFVTWKVFLHLPPPWAGDRHLLHAYHTEIRACLLF